MASNQGPSSSGDGGRPPQEYTVRIQKASNKKCMIMKFNQNCAVDFAECGNANLVRENNLKEYKLSNDLDQLPKFGAGSEYGRDMREEARRKKYGIMVKKYNEENQPWLLKTGQGKQARKHKGVREGGILENASYYIFTQCADGAFEAFPVDEWYNFTPIIKYKYLNSEEAEEEFSRRDKILNHFTIMTKKRLKNEVDDVEDEDEKKAKGKGKKGKSKKDFLLTEMDEWAQLTDDESDEDKDSEAGGSGDEKPKKKKEKKTKKQKKKGSAHTKQNSDDEALEDSDSVDEGQEVDYMTDTDSEDDNMYGDTAKMKTAKYEEKGVDQEENSEEEEEEEEEEKKEEEQEEGEGGEKEKKESESESSGSDSDSDPEKDVSQFSSALFMQAGSKKKSKSGETSKSSSRSATPTSQVEGEGNEKGKKRKQADSVDGATAAKKPKSDGPALTGSDGVTEEIIRKYLVRKPMTIKDLLQKLHKNTGIQKEKLSETIAPILRRINPDKLKINDKLHLHIKGKKGS